MVLLLFSFRFTLLLLYNLFFPSLASFYLPFSIALKTYLDNQTTGTGGSLSILASLDPPYTYTYFGRQDF